MITPDQSVTPCIINLSKFLIFFLKLLSPIDWRSSLHFVGWWFGSWCLNQKRLLQTQTQKVISNKRDQENKNSERLWSLLCDCWKMFDSFSSFEKDVCFVFQTLGFRHQSLSLFIEVRCLLPTLEKKLVLL